MGAPEQNPLTQLALSIQADNHQFNQDLTGAYQQAFSDPIAALTMFDQCWERSNGLEEREMAFLARMGDFGVQQTAVAKNSWRQHRLTILTGKAQAFFMTGRYDKAQAAIDSARAFLAGPEDQPASVLDQLEVGIINMQG